MDQHLLLLTNLRGLIVPFRWQNVAVPTLPSVNECLWETLSRSHLHISKIMNETKTAQLLELLCSLASTLGFVMATRPAGAHHMEKQKEVSCRFSQSRCGRSQEGSPGGHLLQLQSCHTHHRFTFITASAWRQPLLLLSAGLKPLSEQV